MMDLNFFQETTTQEVDNVSKKIFTGGAIVLGIFIAGTLIYNTCAIVKTSRNIDDLEGKIKESQFQAQYNESVEMTKKTNAYTKYNDTLNNIYVGISYRDKIDPTLLKHISYSIPNEVSLTALNIEGGKIGISAKSTSRVAVAEFQHNLGELEFVKDTHVESIASDMADSNEVFTFDISGDLKEEYYSETK